MKDYILLNSQVKKVGANGFWQLEKDKEAMESFQKEVEDTYLLFEDPNERIKYLIDNNYYYKVYEQYTPEQIKRLTTFACNFNFKFKSFMAISKFYRDYALKTNDGKMYLETYEDRVVIVSMYLARGNVERAKRFVNSLMQQNVQPATPTFLNSGKSRGGELVSCFLDEIGDSLNNINHTLSQGGQLSKIGGGYAVNGSKLRGLGDPINEVDGAAKGVVPVMKLFEDMASYADQMGQRPGAFAFWNIIFSNEVIRFIDTKKANADEKIRMKTLSTGLIIPNKFVELAENNSPFYVFSSYSVHKETGRYLDEIDWDIEYDELVANPNIKKSLCKLSARTLLNRIAQTQVESGYPYTFFKDNANREHALKMLGSVNFSNLCTEIMQLSVVSEITNYGEPDQIGFGISCNLASLNIYNVMKNKALKDSVYDAMDMLTAVSDMSDIQNAPSINKANKLLHAVGLGFMNLAGFFAANNIFYDSPIARDFSRSFSMTVNFYSIKRSMEIAIETGETFYGFEQSTYATGEYFDKYLEKDFTPKSKKVKGLFEDMHVPTIEDWAELKEQVMKNGLYHAYRLAIAPTQSISYVQNSTQSIMPITHLIEPRSYGNATTYYPMPFLDARTQYVYQNAYDLDQKAIIDMVAVIQEHVDQGISTTLFVDRSVSTDTISSYIFYANKRKLKSLYYVRNRAQKTEGLCESCSV